jgi:hypothetical protein
MAQYWEDWSGFATGNIAGDPTGWTKRWATAGAALSIVSDAAAPAGKALRVAKSANDRFGLTFNAVDSDANRANCEVRVLFRTPATGLVDGLNVIGAVGRGSGAAAAETAYIANVFCSVESSTVYRKARLTEYNAGTPASAQGWSPSATHVWAANTLHWLRLSCQGTTILWGLATAADPTSEITGSITDSSITAAGWLGLFVLGAASYSVDILAVGFGTNGDAAPVSDPNATATRGARVTLHAGSTPQANLTGILARWWDATTPTGNPVFSATDATTNGSGVITLNLEAVTSLAVGAQGFLLLYKQDGTNHEDSLVFAGRVAVSDIS